MRVPSHGNTRARALMCHRRRQRRESAQRMPAWRGGGLHGPRRRSAPHVTRRSATQCTPGRTGPAGSAGCGYAGRRVDTTTSYASRGAWLACRR